MSKTKGAIKVRDAAKRLGFSTRWVRDRIGTEFVGFLHSKTGYTVSLASIEDYEEKVRVVIRVEKAAAA